jgi:hypothetical protein
MAQMARGVDPPPCISHRTYIYIFIYIYIYIYIYYGSPGLRILKRARIGYGVWTAEPSTLEYNGDETESIQDRRRRDAVG